MTFKNSMKQNLLSIFAILVICGGCSDYSEISPEAYQYSKALYSVCNRKDSARLDKISTQINAAHDQSQLTDKEADWLSEIITTAQAGDWDDATKNARQLMEAQVEGK